MTSYPPRMSSSDAVLWSVEDDPSFRSTIVSVSVFDRSPDRDRFMEAAERVTRSVPRLRQRVVEDPLGLATPRWELDPFFDLDYHVRWVRGPEAGSVEDVLAIAEPLAMQSFDPARPQWEWTVVEGLAEGRAALIAKVHHAITDGVGGIEMALALFDTERDAAPRGELPLPVDEPGHGRWFAGVTHELLKLATHARPVARGVADAAVVGLRSPRAGMALTGSRLAALTRAAAPLKPLSEEMAGRSLSYRYGAMELPLAAFKAAARSNGAKVNDIVLTSLAAGMKLYHDRRGADQAEARFSLMVSTRRDDSVGGNQFVPVRFALPLREASAEVVQDVHERILELREDPIVDLVGPLTSVTRRLPKPLMLPLVGGVQKGVDIISSNVPGWPMDIYAAGAKVERSIPFGPLGGAAVNVTVLSHVDKMHVGITLDPAAVVDRGTFMECLHLGFEQTLALGNSAEGAGR